jgi:hypothetical protein
LGYSVTRMYLDMAAYGTFPSVLSSIEMAD